MALKSKAYIGILYTFKDNTRLRNREEELHSDAIIE